MRKDFSKFVFYGKVNTRRFSKIGCFIFLVVDLMLYSFGRVANNNQSFIKIYIKSTNFERNM